MKIIKIRNYTTPSILRFGVFRRLSNNLKTFKKVFKNVNVIFNLFFRIQYHFIEFKKWINSYTWYSPLVSLLHITRMGHKSRKNGILNYRDGEVNFGYENWSYVAVYLDYFSLLYIIVLNLENYVMYCLSLWLKKTYSSLWNNRLV